MSNLVLKIRTVSIFTKNCRYYNDSNNGYARLVRVSAMIAGMLYATALETLIVA